MAMSNANGQGAIESSVGGGNHVQVQFKERTCGRKKWTRRQAGRAG